jgi:hypothetical protein
MLQDVLMSSTLRVYQIGLNAILLDNFLLYCYARDNNINKCATQYPIVIFYSC